MIWQDPAFSIMLLLRARFLGFASVGPIFWNLFCPGLPSKLKD